MSSFCPNVDLELMLRALGVDGCRPSRELPCHCGRKPIRGKDLLLPKIATRKAELLVRNREAGVSDSEKEDNLCVLNMLEQLRKMLVMRATNTHHKDLVVYQEGIIA